MIEHADEGRWFAFCAAALAVLAWEYVAPLRATTASTIARRWPVNLGLGAINLALMTAFSAPFAEGLGAVGVGSPVGIRTLPHMPGWLAVIVTIAAADIAYYGFHVLQHKVPLLWRLHRIHHSDLEYDFTTSIRFHPLDVVITALVTGATIAITAAPPMVLLVYLHLRQLSDVVGHGNVTIPESIDRVLRAVLVTPNAHRIHHSPDRVETDSNYGGLLTIWDRMFRTYRAEPRMGHEGMRLGLDEFRAPADQTLARMLVLPFDAKRPAPR